MVNEIMTDYTRAALSAADRAMLDYAVALTRSSGSVGKSDIDGLRDHGFDDEDVLRVVNIVGLFNYYNRLVHALGPSPHVHGSRDACLVKSTWSRQDPS